MKTFSLSNKTAFVSIKQNIMVYNVMIMLLFMTEMTSHKQVIFTSTRYDDLLREERTYLQEVSAMEKKFDSWSQLPAPATAAADVKKAASTVTVSLPPAVAAFEVLKKWTFCRLETVPLESKPWVT